MESNDHIKRDNHLNGDDFAGGSAVPDVSLPPSAGEWWKTNASTLVVGAALVAVVCYLWDPISVLKAALGLGFIVFIHELGHFMVAKWCDVHVTTFSIGFGPALPFCSWTRGETTYKLAAFPLGGYVQMVGQVDGDESNDGSDDDPRSYKNKTVWQRMAIISAGVIMNAIFACLAFILIFLVHGKARPAAIVGFIDSGKPAFVNNFRTSAEIVQINDYVRPNFEDLMLACVTSTGKVRIKLQRAGIDKEPILLEVEPHQGSRRVLGLSPAECLKLAAKKQAPQFEEPVYPGSSAVGAGLHFDDIIVGVTNPAHRGDGDVSKMMLPPDPRQKDAKLKDFFEFQKRLTILAGEEVTILVERGPADKRETVQIKVPPTFQKTLGVRMKMDQITAIRQGSAADKAGVMPRRITKVKDQDTTLEGDVIETVEVLGADGKPLVWTKGKDLDPMRLPFQLKKWADEVWAATDGKPTAAQQTVKLQLKRRSAENAGPVYSIVPVELLWDHDWRWDRVLALGISSPEAIPELGLAYLVKNEVETLDVDYSGPLRAGDEIQDLSFVFSKADGGTEDSGWVIAKNREADAVKGVEWAALFGSSILLQSPACVKVKAKVNRGSTVEELELTPLVDKTWPRAERGLLLTNDERLEKADSVLEAIELGFRDTHRWMLRTYLNLRGLAAGTISLRNLGGPLEIARTAYRFSQFDFWEFLGFLALISINLAVLNFLPIPVLDGGHMVFLIYEKLRGKPASEGVRVAATYAGLLLIGCLMIFVLFVDIRRIMGG